MSDLAKTILFIESLASKEEKELCDLMYASPQEYAQLLKSIGALVDKAAGNLNKLYEVVTQLELSQEYNKETHELKHIKHKYGADLVLVNLETQEEQAFEIKNSIVKKTKDYKSNWLFSVNEKLLRRYQDKRKLADLENLIGSIYEKQKNGVTAFIARCGSERLNFYKMSGAFVALYCVKKLIQSSAHSINLGSERCPLCQHYHRILYLQHYSQELDKRIALSGEPFKYKFDYFNAKEWRDILKQVQGKKNCDQLYQETMTVQPIQPCAKLPSIVSNDIGLSTII